MAARVTITSRGLGRMSNEVVEPWLQGVLNRAHGISVRLVNVDSGNLRSTISTRLERKGLTHIDGILFATADYAVWQETEPGDSIPGKGVRRRPGGKPYLRPAVSQAIREFS